MATSKSDADTSRVISSSLSETSGQAVSTSNVVSATQSSISTPVSSSVWNSNTVDSSENVQSNSYQNDTSKILSSVYATGNQETPYTTNTDAKSTLPMSVTDIKSGKSASSTESTALIFTTTEIDHIAHTTTRTMLCASETCIEQSLPERSNVPLTNDKGGMTMSTGDAVGQGDRTTYKHLTEKESGIQYLATEQETTTVTGTSATQFMSSPSMVSSVSSVSIQVAPNAAVTVQTGLTLFLTSFLCVYVLL